VLLTAATGAACLLAVPLTHVCEAFHLFPWMHWGRRHSVGHYIDFWSAVLIINGSGYGAQGVFFTLLLKRFGWTRAGLLLICALTPFACPPYSRTLPVAERLEPAVP
jgi:hypothetical protein